MGIYCFLKRLENRGTFSHCCGSGSPLKIKEEVKRIMEAQLQLDNETTTTQLRRLLAQQGVRFTKAISYRFAPFCAYGQARMGISRKKRSSTRAPCHSSSDLSPLCTLISPH